jgi:uncharacterized Zn finger protein (UPF0148 family)
MSDFDKEAEREKLRKKYEQEQNEREATEKMSELLLQGATMTNAHCSDCGDPIFRYEGQEFCATCEKAVDRVDGDDSQSDGDGDTENIEVTSPDDGARVAFGGENADSEANGTQSRATADQQTPDHPTPEQPGPDRQAEEQRAPEPTPETQADRPADTRAAPEQPSQPRQQAPTREAPSIDPDVGADVTTARESLVRTLTRFSQRAEATEDPQRAGEYLAAAREAAETLSALRQ